MTIPFASISYFLGSVIFFAGTIWYLVDAASIMIPYLGLACAVFYLTASSIQLGFDLRPQREPAEEPSA